MLNSPNITINHITYSKPVLYGEYVQGILYIIHSNKKIALNIPPQKLSEFIHNLFLQTQSQFSTNIHLIFLKSFEVLTQEINLQTKKYRNKMLPDAIFLIPSQVSTQTETIHIFNTEPSDIIQFTPINNRLYFDYPNETKTNFINRISTLQKKLDQPTNINFSFTTHSKLNNQQIANKILTNSSSSIFFQNSDFSLISSLIPHSKLNPNIQKTLLTEKHPRSFQHGQLEVISTNQTQYFNLENPTEIIQENLTHHLSTPLTKQTKPFNIYQKLQKHIQKTSVLLQL